ncbi:hypothetical protein BDZ88DRAFT_123548, partial [Geranomyces variabilis]
ASFYNYKIHCKIVDIVSTESLAYTNARRLRRTRASKSWRNTLRPPNNGRRNKRHLPYSSNRPKFHIKGCEGCISLCNHQPVLLFFDLTCTFLTSSSALPLCSPPLFLRRPPRLRLTFSLHVMMFLRAAITNVTRVTSMKAKSEFGGADAATTATARAETEMLIGLATSGKADAADNAIPCGRLPRAFPTTLDALTLTCTAIERGITFSFEPRTFCIRWLLFTFVIFSANTYLTRQPCNKDWECYLGVEGLFV